MDDEHVERLQRAGAHVLTFNPTRWYTPESLNFRTHRKILVVDGEVGFTGGAGVADHWRGNAQSKDQWRDTQVQVRGPIVRLLEAAFYENAIESRRPNSVPSSTRAAGARRHRHLDPRSQLVVGRQYPSRAALPPGHRVGPAQRSTDDAVLRDRRIDRMGAGGRRRRGVRVRVLVESDVTDALPVKYASRDAYDRLMQLGIELFEYQPTMMHAKTMVVDGVLEHFGSANFDNRSLELNDELNVAVWDRALAARFTADLESDLRASRRLDLERWRQRPFMQKNAGTLLELFRGGVLIDSAIVPVVRSSGCAVVRLSDLRNPGSATITRDAHPLHRHRSPHPSRRAVRPASGQTAAGPLASEHRLDLQRGHEPAPRRLRRPRSRGRRCSTASRAIDPLHARVRDGAGLRAEPRGDHHRHVPERHRRAAHADDRGRGAGAAGAVSRRAAVLRQGVSRVPARRRLLHEQSREDRLPVRRAVHDLGRPRRRRRTGGTAATAQPFFSVFNLEVTHESQSLSRQPGAQGQAARHQSGAGRACRRTTRTRRSCAKSWRACYDNIADMDAQVGEILRQLEEDGLADNTIVFYWSDHGDGIPRSKRSLYDSGLRVPLMIRRPRRSAPRGAGRGGGRSGQPHRPRADGAGARGRRRAGAHAGAGPGRAASRAARPRTSSGRATAWTPSTT